VYRRTDFQEKQSALPMVHFSCLRFQTLLLSPQTSVPSVDLAV